MTTRQLREMTDRTAVSLAPDRGDVEWLILPATWQALGSDAAEGTPAQWLAGLVNENSVGVVAEEEPIASIPDGLAEDGYITDAPDWRSLVGQLTRWMVGR